MSSPALINFLYAVVAIVLGALSIPLLMRKVGPNGLYGFRTSKTTSDEKIWYPVNEALGRGQLVAAIALLLTTGVLWQMGAELGTATVAIIDGAVTLVAMGIAIAYATSVMRKL